MRPLGETRRHFWLAQRMARAGGLNLARSRARGDFDQAHWAGMVQRCRGCGWTTDCEALLARGGKLETLPRECCNRVQFGALLALEEMEGN